MSIPVEIEGRGVVAEFPDGTPQEVIDAAVKRDFFSSPLNDAVKGAQRAMDATDFSTEGRTKKGLREYIDEKKKLAPESLSDDAYNRFPAADKEILAQAEKNRATFPLRPSPTAIVESERRGNDLAQVYELNQGEQLQKGTAGYLQEAPNVEQPGDFLKPDPGPQADIKTPLRAAGRLIGSATKEVYRAGAAVSSSIDAAGNIVKAVVGAPLTRPDEGVTGWLNKQANESQQYVTGVDENGAYTGSPVALAPEYRKEYPKSSLASDAVDTTGGFATQMLLSRGSATGFGLVAGGTKLAEGQNEYLKKHPDASPLEAYNAAMPAALAKGYLFSKMGDVTGGASLNTAMPLTRAEAATKLATNLASKTVADTGYMLESGKIEGNLDKAMGVNPDFDASSYDKKEVVVPTLLQALAFSGAHTAGVFYATKDMASASDYTALLNAYAAARGSKMGTPAYEADANTVSQMIKASGAPSKEAIQSGVLKLRKITADKIINEPDSPAARENTQVESEVKQIASPPTEPAPPVADAKALERAAALERLNAAKAVKVPDFGIGDPNVGIDKVISDFAGEHQTPITEPEMPPAPSAVEAPGSSADLAAPPDQQGAPTIVPTPVGLEEPSMPQGIPDTSEGRSSAVNVAQAGAPAVNQSAPAGQSVPGAPAISPMADKARNLKQEGTTDGNVPVRQESSEGQAPLSDVRNADQTTQANSPIATPAPQGDLQSQATTELTHKIVRQAYNEKTGKWAEFKQEVPATEALAHTEDRISILRKLLDCVKG